jgi:predicted kinase
LAGRPGTGKTTLGRRLAAELRAAYLRIDAIEAAVVRCRLAASARLCVTSDWQGEDRALRVSAEALCAEIHM